MSIVNGVFVYTEQELTELCSSPADLKEKLEQNPRLWLAEASDAPFWRPRTFFDFLIAKMNEADHNQNTELKKILRNFYAKLGATDRTDFANLAHRRINMANTAEHTLGSFLNLGNVEKKRLFSDNLNLNIYSFMSQCLQEIQDQTYFNVYAETQKPATTPHAFSLIAALTKKNLTPEIFTRQVAGILFDAIICQRNIVTLPIELQRRYHTLFSTACDLMRYDEVSHNHEEISVKAKNYLISSTCQYIVALGDRFPQRKKDRRYTKAYNVVIQIQDILKNERTNFQLSDDALDLLHNDKELRVIWQRYLILFKTRLNQRDFYREGDLYLLERSAEKTTYFGVNKALKMDAITALQEVVRGNRRPASLTDHKTALCQPGSRLNNYFRYCLTKMPSSTAVAVRTALDLKENEQLSRTPYQYYLSHRR